MADRRRPQQRCCTRAVPGPAPAPDGAASSISQTLLHQLHPISSLLRRGGEFSLTSAWIGYCANEEASHAPSSESGPLSLKSRLGEVMVGDFCRMCERRVIDLTDMSDGERVALLAGCSDKVCVSYRFPVRPALAAAALAAALPTAAAAQDLGPAVPDAAAIAAVADQLGALDQSQEYIVVGGIDDPHNVQYVENPADASLPGCRSLMRPAAPPFLAPGRSLIWPSCPQRQRRQLQRGLIERAHRCRRR